jgi:tRNA-specific 2-thiouridylase
MRQKRIKVLCAMSGGVDSSVAAALLKKQGYDVVGIFMKFWSEPTPPPSPPIRGDEHVSPPIRGDEHVSPPIRGDEHVSPLIGGVGGVNLNKCCSVDAYMAAKKVAQILDIPLYTVNFKEDFKKKIVDNFLAEYQVGLTPNPCVRCNQFIKFGLLLDKAKQYGADYVATGHYARLRREIPNSKFQISNKSKIQNTKCQIQLLKGKDKNKDQSYFLYTLTQDKLRHILFPVGKYTKSEVRQFAKKFKLPVAQKQESQELCFISEKDHYNFLRRYLKLKKGDIVTVEGKRVGQHKGLPLYTIGQRKGIEIGGTGPYYVVELDFKKNQLIVANNKRHPALLRDNLICKKTHWIAGVEPKLPLKCKARVRYRQEEEIAIVSFVKNGAYMVKFKNPQRAITGGQSVVFYDGVQILGGGIIVE